MVVVRGVSINSFFVLFQGKGLVNANHNLDHHLSPINSTTPHSYSSMEWLFMLMWLHYTILWYLVSLTILSYVGLYFLLRMYLFTK